MKENATMIKPLSLINVKILLLALFALLPLATSAQVEKDPFYNRYTDYREVLRDTSEYAAPTYTEVKDDTLFDPLRVVTNKFGKNWFFFATAGAHSFQGDYSHIGKFSGTISPDWGLGVGKWFTPGVGLKMEFIRGNSESYTEYLTGHYGHGPIRLTKKGKPYRDMRTAWWDISASAVLNLTRLFLGYEGYGSHKRMNQFIVNAGIGGVHHMGYGHKHGSDNEWSGHLELQWSRFFTPKKNFSLDLKARGLFYQTNFDLEYGQNNHAAKKWDANIGLDLGFTWYMGGRRANGWRQGGQTIYTRDYREKKILVVREKEKKVKQKVLTFYVFYPNNYSGRDDAPQAARAKVNAIDYLAGGIFTQKRYVSNGDVAQRLAAGVPLASLKTTDIPTERANQELSPGFIPRGYELAEQPLTLPMERDSLLSFREKTGYYYAPLFDGEHSWGYRIDPETMGQKLLFDENYQESNSYGLNAHRGLPLLRQRMKIDEGDQLVSFADIYAALTSNKGYIARFTDSASVALARDILTNGVITMIQAEGTATNQDNYRGEHEELVHNDRNTALAQNRALTVIAWLKGLSQLEDVATQIYQVGNMMSDVRPVPEGSTRVVNAKLNRCTKVRIHYMVQQ